MDSDDLRSSSKYYDKIVVYFGLLTINLKKTITPLQHVSSFLFFPNVRVEFTSNATSPREHISKRKKQIFFGGGDEHNYRSTSRCQVKITSRKTFTKKKSQYNILIDRWRFFFYGERKLLSSVTFCRLNFTGFRTIYKNLRYLILRYVFDSRHLLMRLFGGVFVDVRVDQNISAFPFFNHLVCYLDETP